jgi:hypothetical protein
MRPEDIYPLNRLAHAVAMVYGRFTELPQVPYRYIKRHLNA